MRSAIGDYIHYTDMGYSGFGTKKPPYYSSFSSAIREREQQLEYYLNIHKSKDNQKLEQEIQSILDLLKNLQNKDLHLQGSLSEYEWDSISLLNMIWDELQDEGFLDVDKFIAASNNIISGKEGYYRGIEQYAASEEYLVKVKLHLTETINSMIDIVSGMTTNIVAKEQLKKEIAKIDANNQQKFINELKNIQFKYRIKSTKNLSLLEKRVDAEFRTIQQIISRKNFNQEVSEQINALIQSFIENVGLIQNLSGYSGKVGEVITRIAGAALLDTAKNATDQAIAEVVGEEKSARGLLLGKYSGISTQFVNSEQLKRQGYETVAQGRFITTVKQADEKVDVKIQLKDANNNIKNGLYASVKNFNTNTIKAIKFQSANLLSLLSNENYNNIVNHYLNLNTIKWTSANASDKQNSRMEVNQYMKKIVLFKLVTGFNTVTGVSNSGRIQTMNSANVFVVINSDTFKVKVYNMSSLLKNEFRTSKFKNSQTLLPIYQPIDPKRSQFPSAKERITNILLPLMRKTSYSMNKQADFIKE